MTILEIPFGELNEPRDIIAQIFSGSLRGVIVRGLLSPDMVAEMVRQFDRHGRSLPTFSPPVFKGYVIGRPLVSAADGLDGYLEEADRFRTGSAALWADYPQVEQRIHDALALIAGTLGVSVPHGKDGRSYLAATVRVLIEGDRLPLHYENETFGNPAMDALRPTLDMSTLMSFYIPLATSPSGGLLRLFETSCLDGGDSLIDRLGGEERARPYFEEHGFATVLPGIGDLFIFDGGRWYHDVTPIEGGTRWTLGGFLALTSDHRTVHYWS